MSSWSDDKLDREGEEMNEGFAKVDERFERVDERLAQTATRSGVVGIQALRLRPSFQIETSRRRSEFFAPRPRDFAGQNGTKSSALSPLKDLRS